MTKRLYELKRGSPLRIDGKDATFHHVDGSYSLCQFATGESFHLVAWAELVEVDGRWELAPATSSRY